MLEMSAKALGDEVELALGCKNGVVRQYSHLERTCACFKAFMSPS